MANAVLIWKAALGTKPRVVSTKRLREMARRMGLKEESVVRTLKRKNHIVPLFKGYYYLRSPEEILLHKPKSPLELFAHGARVKNIGNWYFGLYTALRLNGMSHEHRNDEYVISDAFYRPAGIRIAGKTFVILKWRPGMGRFGLKRIRNYWVADAEKTVLDFAFWDHYRMAKGHSPTLVWKEHMDAVDVNRIGEYLDNYPVQVRKLVEEAL